MFRESISALEALVNFTPLELEAIGAIGSLAQSQSKPIYIRPIAIPVDPIKRLKAQRSLELNRERLATAIKHSMAMEELRCGSPGRLQHLSRRLEALPTTPIRSKSVSMSKPRLRVQHCIHDGRRQAR